jgi:hypothetical protein
MAGISGLLGALSGPSGGYASLLDEEELAQARRSAQADALLNLSSSLFKAGAPSRTPVGMGQALIGGLQGASKSYQDKIGSALQEKMNMQKMQQAMQSQKRAAEVQGLIGGAYRPAQAATQGIMDSPDVVVPPTQATPARFDLQAIAPQLMQTAEGRAALGELMGAQNAMRPEMFSLAEGATQFERDPMTGEVRQVGAGASKESPAYRDYQRAISDGSFKGSFLDYQLALKKAGATNVSVGGDKALSSTVGKDIGSMIGIATEQATVARETLDNADRIYSALDKAIVGPAADTRTVLLRVGQSLGVAGKDADEILANTAVLVQGLANGELQAAAAMKGQGQITENERLIIKRASAGTQNMSATEIKAALMAIRKVAQNKIKRHDTLYNQFKQLEGMKKYAPFYELPPYQPSTGGSVDPFQKKLDEEARRRGL